MPSSLLESLQAQTKTSREEKRRQKEERDNEQLTFINENIAKWCNEAAQHGDARQHISSLHGSKDGVTFDQKTAEYKIAEGSFAAKVRDLIEQHGLRPRIEMKPNVDDDGTQHYTILATWDF